MPAEKIALNSFGLDLSSRIVATSTVVASPSANAETIIAQTAAIPGSVGYVSGALIMGWAAYTVGTSGTAVTLKIRQTNVSGSTISSSGALTGSQHGAGILSADDVNGFDTGPAAGQVYVLTMTVANGAATSTVSQVWLAVVAV